MSPNVRMCQLSLFRPVCFLWKDKKSSALPTSSASDDVDDADDENNDDAVNIVDGSILIW